MSIDPDEDLVPDRSLQYDEFVGEKDPVPFETYTDFDGYAYTRSVKGGVLDYRGESAITTSGLSHK